MGWIAAAAAVASAVIGGAAQSKSGKDSTKAQKKAADKQIDFARESRNIELGRTEPYVQAGHSALSALMSLTRLSGPQTPTQAQAPLGDTGSVLNQYQPAGGSPNVPVTSRRSLFGEAPEPSLRRRSLFADDRFEGRVARYAGGPTEPGTIYNVNEMGPENRYVGGRVIRDRNPMTIDGEAGYVEPNIEGRFLGGLTRLWKKTSPIAKHTRISQHDARSGKKKWKKRALAAEQTVAGYGDGSYQPQQHYTNNFSGNANTTAINPETGYPNENPGGVEGGYNFQTDPGYQFRFAEGMRGLERSAAARGGLLSGGFARKAIRYGQGHASNEFTNVYNRIAGIAGIGQTANSQANQSSQFASGMINNATGNAGYARASGYMNQGNIYGDVANQLGRVDWGNIFNRNGGGGPDPRYDRNTGTPSGPPRNG